MDGDSAHPPHRPAALTRPHLPKLSKEETESVFDEIITGIRTFSEEVESPFPSPLTPHTPITPGTPLTTHSEVKDQTPGTPEVNHQLHDVTEDKGQDGTEEPPKTLDISDTGTLKKKGKLSAVKRIGSPLTKARRKSVSNKQESKLKFGAFKRKGSMPDIPAKPYEPSTSPVAMETIYHTLKQSDQVTSCEPMNTALKLMVTLSSNKECTSTLISYICLPKCEGK